MQAADQQAYGRCTALGDGTGIGLYTVWPLYKEAFLAAGSLAAASLIPETQAQRRRGHTLSTAGTLQNLKQNTSDTHLSCEDSPWT